MREYKIVEMKNGHGNAKFQIKGKQGWGWFSIWGDWGALYNTMQEATDEVENYIDDEKTHQSFKVKEYAYTAVPNHIPEEQAGKFMEIKKKS